MGQQGEGHLQAGGQQGGVQAVGPPQEQARHELRDDGTSPEVTFKLENSTRYRYSLLNLIYRYYYQRGILAKVDGQRLVYQFVDVPKIGDIVEVDCNNA